MVSRSENFVIYYLLTSQEGENIKRNGKETKKMKIGESIYYTDLTGESP